MAYPTQQAYDMPKLLTYVNLLSYIHNLYDINWLGKQVQSL